MNCPKPLSDEFATLHDQHSLGQSLEDALKGAATRVNSTDFAFFVTSVLIQRRPDRRRSLGSAQ